MTIPPPRDILAVRHWPHGTPPSDVYPHPPATVCGIRYIADPLIPYAGSVEHVNCEDCATLLTTGEPWVGVPIYTHSTDGRRCWYDGNRDPEQRWRRHDDPHLDSPGACLRYHPVPGLPGSDRVSPEDDVLLDLIPALAPSVAARLRVLMADAAATCATEG